MLARIYRQKNPFGLLEAVDIVRRERPLLDLTVDWYGDHLVAESRRSSKWDFRYRQKEAEHYSRLKQTIADRSLQDRFRLHPAVRDVVTLYRMADAVCLPSFYEGTSNVICEAMACGVPLLVSRVSDSPRLVHEGRNGLLFDPESPQDIADAILRFADTPPEARRRMGLDGRRMAEAMLPESAFVDNYIKLIDKILSKNKGRAGV